MINKPIQEVSTLVQLVLAVSGLTWTRYCFVITPKNVPLAGINFFMASVAVFQLGRKWRAGNLVDFL
jgi:hypothetical protein